MEIQSLGLATDLALIATRGRVVDRGTYVVAVTPEDPGYHYGNLVVLPGPPQAGEVVSSIELFAREVAVDPAIRHVTLCWDGVTGDAGAAAELTCAGFELDTTLVMTAHAVRPAAAPGDIELRALTPDELARAAELDFAISGGPSEAHRQFLHRRAAWFRDLVVHRVAQFCGAFDDRTLVGSLGLVRLGRLGRSQDVQVARSHRRRGIAAALLSVAADEAIAAGVEQLVIKTLSNSDAERVYARAGFRTIERTVSACRAPAISG
jgi:GNAT superfamily N-acetyltransferase